MTEIGLAGKEDWLKACRAVLGPDIRAVHFEADGQPEENIPLLINGSSLDWYPFLDRALRKGNRILLGNPGSWSYHDLDALQHIADESGVELYTYRPWRTTLPLPPDPLRLLRISITAGVGEKWKPYLGHAVDRIVHALGTDNLLRADASRSTDKRGMAEGRDEPDIMSMLLVNLRFQNGSMAQISLERGSESGVFLFAPSLGIRLSDTNDTEVLKITLETFVNADPDLPTLNEALSGRKIEEKIFAILRTN